jgi:hypothetical protein
MSDLFGERTPAQRVQVILAAAVGRDLSSWERFEFLPNIQARTTLTAKQEQVLRGIEIKVLES